MAAGGSSRDGWETGQKCQQATSLGKWELDVRSGLSGRKPGKAQDSGWDTKDLPWGISNEIKQLTLGRSEDHLLCDFTNDIWEALAAFGRRISIK